MRFIIISFLLLVCSNKLFSYNQNFYFDTEISENNLRILKKLEKKAENNIDQFDFFENPRIELTKTESKDQIDKKNREQLSNIDSIRIFCYMSKDLDTIRIQGFSTLYNSSNKLTSYYLIPLINIERNIDSNEYSEVNQILIKGVKSHFESITKYSIKAVEFKIASDYKVLEPFFYLFTCAETNLYNSPHKDDKIKDRWLAHKILSNNNAIDLDYYKFPYPNRIIFSLETELIRDTITRLEDYEWKGSNFSNSLIVLSYNFIGLEFIHSNSKFTFWTRKEDIEYLLDDNPIYTNALSFFFHSSLINSLNPL